MPSLKYFIHETTRIITNYTTEPVPDHLRMLSMNLTQDLPFIFISAIMLYMVRRWLSRNVFEKMADRWGVQKSDRQRFIENAWFSLYYTIMVATAFVVMYDAPWIWKLKDIYSDYPHEHLRDEQRCPYLKKYYLVALAFYSQALYTLLFVDERMKDFKEMVTHHITTIILIFASFATVTHRFGSVVILLHDVVDIFLYTAKMLHIAKFEILANSVFGVFAFTFLLLRLMLLPFISYLFCCGKYRLEYPGLQYVFAYIPNATTPIEVTSYGMCVNRYCVSTLYFMGILVVALVCLHAYWFVLVIDVIKRVVAGDVKDPRQYEDGESSDNSATTKDEKQQQQHKKLENKQQIDEKPKELSVRCRVPQRASTTAIIL